MYTFLAYRTECSCNLDQFCMTLAYCTCFHVLTLHRDGSLVFPSLVIWDVLILLVHPVRVECGTTWPWMGYIHWIAYTVLFTTCNNTSTFKFYK